MEGSHSTPRNGRMEPEPLLDSLRNAVTAMPDDVPLRLHLATMLLRAGHRDEAVRHLGAVLQRDPAFASARPSTGGRPTSDTPTCGVFAPA